MGLCSAFKPIFLVLVTRLFFGGHCLSLEQNLVGLTPGHTRHQELFRNRSLLVAECSSGLVITGKTDHGRDQDPCWSHRERRGSGSFPVPVGAPEQGSWASGCQSAMPQVSELWPPPWPESHPGYLAAFHLSPALPTF